MKALLSLLLLLPLFACAGETADPATAGHKALAERDYHGAVEHFRSALASAAQAAEKLELGLALCRALAHEDLAASKQEFLDLARAGALETKAYTDIVREYFNLGAEGLGAAVEVVHSGLQQDPENEKLKQYLDKLKAEAAKDPGGDLASQLKGLGYL